MIDIGGNLNHESIAMGIAADILFHMVVEALDAVISKSSFVRANSKIKDPWDIYLDLLKEAKKNAGKVYNDFSKQHLSNLKEKVGKMLVCWEAATKELMSQMEIEAF